ncbi:hypothetical protein [Sedimenticola thiotaurini]|uniref:Uncharacterized protein n=1 Tax=Sedimenticola thiotaurini TaxID=1543721 RepID=A0A0F7JRU3_9GAMM|nr:hypothetical protein [Sedimenticola thiotaurini]AKH19181.1 hypothetical protein AAY24_01155 [Sedimenticola thiotaurini]
MVKLPHSLRDWSSNRFEQSLKTELLALPLNNLPLQQATRGGYVDGSNLQITLLQQSATPTQLQVKVGVFFNEIIVGCSCGDDPVNEPIYCEMHITIDRRTGASLFELM